MFGLVFYFTDNWSALVASAFGAIWEGLEGGFIKFMVKTASKQDQTLHMEGKLHVILYFSEECTIFPFLAHCLHYRGSDRCSFSNPPVVTTSFSLWEPAKKRQKLEIHRRFTRSNWCHVLIKMVLEKRARVKNNWAELPPWLRVPGNSSTNIKEMTTPKSFCHF